MAIKPGQKLPGAGRPKGSKQIFSKDSVKKLEELGFDPIEKMTELYEEVKEKIAIEEAKKRPSVVAINGMLSTLQKISADLMRYGYGRTPEEKGDAEQEKKSDTTISIKLN